MANESIKAAFERFWEHVVSRIGEKADINHTHDIYETKESANGKLTEAKQYTDTEVAALVNSAPETLDTLGELAIALQENKSVTETLDAAITTKANQSDLTAIQTKLNNAETWTFVLENGSTVTKKMVVM